MSANITQSSSEPAISHSQPRRRHRNDCARLTRAPPGLAAGTPSACSASKACGARSAGAKKHFKKRATPISRPQPPPPSSPRPPRGDAPRRGCGARSAAAGAARAGASRREARQGLLPQLDVVERTREKQVSVARRPARPSSRVFVRVEAPRARQTPAASSSGGRARAGRQGRIRGTPEGARLEASRESGPLDTAGILCALTTASFVTRTLQCAVREPQEGNRISGAERRFARATFPGHARTDSTLAVRGARLAMQEAQRV